MELSYIYEVATEQEELNFCLDAQDIELTIKKRSKETKFIKYLLPAEFDIIINDLAKRDSVSLQRCVRCCAYAGLRVSDATQLKEEHVNRQWPRLEYTDHKTGFHQIREIPVWFWEELLQHITENKHRMIDGYLFPPDRASRNPHIQGSTIRHFFKDVRERHGWDIPYYTCKDGKKLYRVSPHTLKHYCAWKLYKASGDNLVFVQEYFNHQEPKHTLRYVRGMEAKLYAADYVNRAWASA
jgi:integrase